jgi:uncharacterized membrane protein YdjX (TVP38/TMEM64 family)
MARGRVSIGKILAIFALAGLVVFLQLRYDLSSYLSQQNVRALLSRAGFFAPPLYMAIMAAAVIVSPIPSLPLDILAGAFFGAVLGTLYSALGAVAGACAAFLIARGLGRELVERFTRGHIAFCTDCSDRLLTRIVFFSRLIPFVSFDIVSYGAGLTKMSLGRFAAASFLGMLPLTAIYNTFGGVLVVGNWVSIAVGAVFVAGFLLVPRLIERHNFLSLRRYFTHAGAGTNETRAADSRDGGE